MPSTEYHWGWFNKLSELRGDQERKPKPEEEDSIEFDNYVEGQTDCLNSDEAAKAVAERERREASAALAEAKRKEKASSFFRVNNCVNAYQMLDRVEDSLKDNYKSWLSYRDDINLKNLKKGQWQVVNPNRGIGGILFGDARQVASI